MKIDLIGMILNHTDRERFEGLIIDDNGRELDAVGSLDAMIMEYARVRQGGASDVVVVPRRFMEPDEGEGCGCFERKKK